ncbi:hypothetical protein V8C26DRAFT_363116 [Trichoderma gracile]
MSLASCVVYKYCHLRSKTPPRACPRTTVTTAWFEEIHYATIPIMARSMSSYSMSSDYFNGYASDYEEKLLNTVWMGIVGLEVLMVLGVAARGVFRRLSPHLKLRSQ